MKKISLVVLLSCLWFSCGEKKQNDTLISDTTSQKVQFMTLDPGHFHAALVQKSMYEQVDSVVHVFAPEGPEVEDFLSKIKQYNSRSENPTNWKINAHLSDDYLEQMLAKKPGNVMVVAGKNSKKIDYILAAVKAGLNVYADKPLVIDPEGFVKLKEAFEIAEENGLLIYDIMTERFEATTMMQKLISTVPGVFGELVDGSPEEPSISKESVHHFFKYVSGKPLVRPAWFFDVNEEGEGIVDVTTHLVDLVQWEAFPEQLIDSSEVNMLKARRWPTILTKDQFSRVTGLAEFPSYLEKDIIDDKLHTYSNGEMLYTIKGKHAKVSVMWNYQAPEGTGDTHYSIMRGTLTNLIIRQGKEENYKPILFVVPVGKIDLAEAINSALENEIARQFPGTTVLLMEDGSYRINIPGEFKIGHEAHFGQVTENYLSYLADKKFPDWEVPNMKTKYYTTIQAFKMAKQN